MEHELGLTALFNDYLAGLGAAILSMVCMTAENPERPWQNWIVMELLVIALLMVTVAVLRARLSVDKPGKLQHIFEMVWGFINDTVDQVGIHHGERYAPYIGTIFILILSCNLIGMIPGLESPTMVPYVPAGLAIVTFVYYNLRGFQANGIGYLKHLAGPIWWLAPLMIPIEIISHFVRPLSLTVRLYGNMFAGEQVTNVFLGLTKLVIPVVLMGLHVFVAVVQAYVFTLLTTIYVSMATAHDH